MSSLIWFSFIMKPLIFVCPFDFVNFYSFLARLNNVQEELFYYPGIGVRKCLSCTSKVFRTSLFPNPVMDLVHIWYDDRYWSKILRSIISIRLHDLKVKVMDLVFLC